MLTDELNFDLTPQTVPVTLSGKRYVLKEASAGDITSFKNQAVAKAKVVAGKVEGLGNTADLEPLLVSYCLHEADDAGSPAKRVDVKTISAWPNRVLNGLVKVAKNLSGLEDEETREVLTARLKDTQDKLARLDGEDVAKKSQGPTGESSDSAAS